MISKYRTKSTIDQAKAESSNPFSRLRYYSAINKARHQPTTLSRALRPKHILSRAQQQKMYPQQQNQQIAALFLIRLHICLCCVIAQRLPNVVNPFKTMKILHTFLLTVGLTTLTTSYHLLNFHHKVALAQLQRDNYSNYDDCKQFFNEKGAENFWEKLSSDADDNTFNCSGKPRKSQQDLAQATIEYLAKHKQSITH